MLRKLAIGVVCSMLVLVSAHAQEPTFPGCHCGTIGYVDIPATSATVSNAALLAGWQAVEGWGFQYPYGQLLDRVDLFVEDDVTPGMWHPVQEPDNLSTGYARPDVLAAYGAQSGANGQTGFIRWIGQPLPLGAHRFTFVLWSGSYHANVIKTLNVVP